jgi:hypothetical protein
MCSKDWYTLLLKQNLNISAWASPFHHHKISRSCRLPVSFSHVSFKCALFCSIFHEDNDCYIFFLFSVQWCWWLQPWWTIGLLVVHLVVDTRATDLGIDLEPQWDQREAILAHRKGCLQQLADHQSCTKDPKKVISLLLRNIWSYVLTFKTKEKCWLNINYWTYLNHKRKSW